MPLWSRIANVFRGERVSREINEELQSHIEEAIEQGHSPEEARRAFGSVLRQSELSGDVRVVEWLAALRSDVVFGWRQLAKQKVTSSSAILSLALAIGSCTAAFRLIDAALLAPLPVEGVDSLFVLNHQFMTPEGKRQTSDSCAYPMFRNMRALVRDQAELIAATDADRIDLTFSSDDNIEKAYWQYVSGWMFPSFGLSPAAGRLFTENDDRTPGGHPYAVISYDFWSRRFARDPGVVGSRFRTGTETYEIIGVAPKAFTGTEPGTVIDIFVPTMMMKNNGTVRSDYQWFRTFVKLRPGVSVTSVRERLNAPFHSFLESRVKELSGMPRQMKEAFLAQTISLEPASAGVSGLQKTYGPSLAILAALVGMMLLIACANVANLMIGRGSARQREMALRISIGAGRWRLVQLLLVECACLAILATLAGMLIAGWATPLVVEMISLPDYPTRLIFSDGWRLFAFALTSTLFVTVLFGLAPALQASAVKPVSALKGGDSVHRRSRLMRMLIAAQAAFCFLVLFVAGLFVSTFGRLSHQPIGFSEAGLVTLETRTAKPQPAALWKQVAEQLKMVPGVETVAISEWPLLAGESWNGFVSANSDAPSPIECSYLAIAPGWLGTMKIPLIAGRDFRDGDRMPGTAIVNRTFAARYLGTHDPVGRFFDVVSNEGPRIHYEIVGLTADARYRDMRSDQEPVAYFPFERSYSRASFIVRTVAPDPRPLSAALRIAVSQARPGFHVSAIRTQAALIAKHTLRERVLAVLGLFFAIVALLLAGVGLYGVLDYSVLQRRREIGIRLAIGAPAGSIARRITRDAFAMVSVGLLAGFALATVSVRALSPLLFQVNGSGLQAFVPPAFVILTVTLIAAIPAIRRAVSVDPASTLRSD